MSTSRRPRHCQQGRAPPPTEPGARLTEGAAGNSGHAASSSAVRLCWRRSLPRSGMTSCNVIVALVRHHPGSDSGGELLAPLVLVRRRNRTSAASLGGSSDYCGVCQGRPDIVAVGCMLMNQPRSATAADTEPRRAILAPLGRAGARLVFRKYAPVTTSPARGPCPAADRPDGFVLTCAVRI